MSIYSIPSKTFICGEYGVLYGGNAVLVATNPSFIIGEKIHDPYNGGGGFGLSGAKFIASQAKDGDFSGVIEEFKNLHNGQSGSDVICQIFGKITIIESGKYFSLDWPFDEYEILIFKNSSKINTHEHLENLPAIDVKLINSFVDQVIYGVKKVNINYFTRGINLFFKYLIEQGLVSKDSLRKVNKLRKNCKLLAVKGCGTLCHDVIITVNHKSESEKIKSFAKSLDLIYTANSEDIRGGAYVVS